MSARRSSGLRGQVVSGIGWKAASTVSIQITRMAVAIVLARLLTPHEFGVAAALLVFSGLALLLTDLALGAALVQRPTITELDRSTIFWTSVALGVGLTAICVLSAPAVAAFYGEPEMAPMLRVFAITFLLSGLAATQGALMTRALSFRTLELRMIVATVVGAVVGVWIAVAGGGAWAIIAQALATTATSTALLWVASDWRPRAMFSWERLRDLGSSGLRMFGTQITFFLNKNTDNVLIGRMLGPAALGVYAIAFNLMLFPITRIAGPIRSVLFPALSRVQQDRARLIRGWLTGSRVIAAVAAPAMLGMVAVAPDFVPVVLGDQWREAVPVLQILALVGLLQAMQIVGGSALNAVGAFGTTLRFTIASYLLNVVAFLAGMPWGIEGVAVAYAISTAVMFPVFIALTAGHIGARAGDYARAVGDVLACAAAMGAAVALARWGLVAAGAGAGLRLAGLVAVGAAVYTALILLLCPGLVREMRDLRGRRTRPAADAVSGG